MATINLYTITMLVIRWQVDLDCDPDRSGEASVNIVADRVSQDPEPFGSQEIIKMHTIVHVGIAEPVTPLDDFSTTNSKFLTSVFIKSLTHLIVVCPCLRLMFEISLLMCCMSSCCWSCFACI